MKTDNDGVVTLLAVCLLLALVMLLRSTPPTRVAVLRTNDSDDNELPTFKIVK